VKGRTSRRRARPPAVAAADTDARPRVRPVAIACVLTAFLAVFVTLEVVAHSQKSGTWDEPMHLTAGYVALAERDYLVDPSHPPFMRMWAALPLLTMPVHMDSTALDRTTTPRWAGESYEFARRFLYVHNDADRLLYASRTMIVIWGAVLGILLFAWTHEWLGFAPAVIALVFYTLEPNIAAHASLVTTDFGITCFMFGAVYFLWRTCRRASLFNLCGLTLFFALAVVTKFSGLILGPIVLVLLAVSVFYTREVSAKRAAVLVLVLAVTTFTAIWAIYGFRYAPTPAERAVLRYEDSAFARQNAPALASAIGWLDARRVLPNAFTQGLLYNQATARQLPAFLAGEYSNDGWWYYFPAAFLLKTPAVLLVLLAGGVLVYARRRRHLGLSNELFVVAPIAIYLAVAMTSSINVGLRHILPIYPFVLLMAAAGAGALLTARRRVGAIALVAMTAFWAVMFAAVYPHTLTFFNEFVGGPRNGSRYLSDSNLDWGQHLKSLKKWMDETGVSHVNLAYFGTADPAYYGIECTHLPGAPTFALPEVKKPRLPGYVAISATVESGVYLDPRWRLFYRSFRDRTPVADVGNALRVYWVDRWPEASDVVESAEDIDAHAGLADALLFGQQWIDHAIIHYRTYLRYRPDDVQVMTNLGLALTTQGDSAAAIDVMQRAVTVAPQDPAAQDILGVAWATRGRMREAAAAFERALAIDPGYSPARTHLARISDVARR